MGLMLGAGVRPEDPARGDALRACRHGGLDGRDGPDGPDGPGLGRRVDGPGGGWSIEETVSPPCRLCGGPRAGRSGEQGGEQRDGCGDRGNGQDGSAENLHEEALHRVEEIEKVAR
jgi:hypothetical protein